MIVRKVAVKQIAAATQQTTTIDDIDINLFTGASRSRAFASPTRRGRMRVQFKDLALKSLSAAT